METLGTVLVHEPDPEVRRKIRAVLRREKVVFTSEGPDARDDPTLEPPDAVVVDVDRSDATGFEDVLRLQYLHDIPVVVITANPPFSGKGAHRSEALRPHVAAGIQRAIEEAAIHLAGDAQRVCLAGGLGLNALLVSALEHRFGGENVFVQPASGNAGNSTV